MKKYLVLFMVSMVWISGIIGQNCVTKFEENDFNLSNAYGEITALTIDAQNNKWFGLKSSFQYYGLGKYGAADTLSFSTANSDIPSNTINDIGYEQGGNIWVATASGLAMFDGTSTTGWTIYNTTNSDLPNNSVTAIAVDASNNKWAGFSTGQLAKFDGTNWTFFNDNSNGPIQDIGFDGEGNVWIAINGATGLGMYNQTTWTFFTETEYITSIDTDSEGTPWFSYYDGILKYANYEIVF